MTITFDHVGKTYGDASVAVRDLSLTIPTGQALALVGSSGSGKTTLLRMINRMVDPTSGHVSIDGTDVATMNPVTLRRSIGYVMQNGGLLPHRTVAQNIATVLRLNGVDKHAARAKALELMDRLGLDRSLADRYPAMLSGGQQQRVGVARALATDPDILLMDEPFAAVDPLVRRALQNDVVALHEQSNATIVFVTHDINEAFTVGDRVALLRGEGELAQIGTPEEFVAHPADDFVRDFINAGRARQEAIA